ncbi:MAG: class I SAM-dependent methyltransferase [Chloroflexi bacterium]|nr:class I SAM-dependent methyltransferase [Chloroflexota bacterium]
MTQASAATVSGNQSRIKHTLLRRSTPRAIRFLRSARTLGLYLLDPVDYAARVINNQRRLPPFHLRREVGDPSIFQSSGAEWLSYARLLCDLKPHERVLDVGCGCGLMALFLEDYLSAEGSYTGIDVQAGAVNWCRAHIGRRRDNFNFVHLDRRSGRYNPRGQSGPLRLPFADSSFDLLVVKSVFTHLLREDVEAYAAEISRVLAPGGRCLASWFLLDGDAHVEGSGLNFPFGDTVCRYESEQSPETAVAYAEPYVRNLFARHGLDVPASVRRGTWSGRLDGLSTQDLTIIEKRDAHHD